MLPYSALTAALLIGPEELTSFERSEPALKTSPGDQAL